MSCLFPERLGHRALEDSFLGGETGPALEDLPGQLHEHFHAVYHGATVLAGGSQKGCHPGIGDHVDDRYSCLPPIRIGAGRPRDYRPATRLRFLVDTQLLKLLSRRLEEAGPAGEHVLAHLPFSPPRHVYHYSAP